MHLRSLRSLVLTTIISACLSTAATSIAAAADLPLKARRPGPIIAPYSWNGIYGGANGGYGWGDFLPVGCVTKTKLLHFSPSLELDGGLVGGQIGYNYQLGNWVFGVEIDYQWASIHDSANTPGTLAEAEIRSFGTARGRIGVAWDRWLIFGTAGGAWGRGMAALPGYTPKTANHSGWTIGGGLEYGLTPNLSAKLEHLYLRFNTQDYFMAQGCVISCKIGASVNVVRVGLNYRFDWSVLP